MSRLSNTTRHRKEELEQQYRETKLSSQWTLRCLHLGWCICWFLYLSIKMIIKWFITIDWRHLGTTPFVIFTPVCNSVGGRSPHSTLLHCPQFAPWVKLLLPRVSGRKLSYSGAGGGFGGTMRIIWLRLAIYFLWFRFGIKSCELPQFHF